MHDNEAARQNADRVMAHRARKRVDTSPADLAAERRANKPVSEEVTRLKAEVSQQSHTLAELQREASAIAKATREYLEDSNRPSPSSMRKLEDAHKAVEAADAARRITKADRDRAVAEFDRDVAWPYARRVIDEIAAALAPTMTALGEAVGGIGDSKLTTTWQTLAVGVGAPPIPARNVAPDDLEAVHGAAVVVKDSLNECTLLARESGVTAGSHVHALVMARALVDQLASLRRRRGDG